MKQETLARISPTGEKTNRERDTENTREYQGMDTDKEQTQEEWKIVKTKSEDKAADINTKEFFRILTQYYKRKIIQQDGTDSRTRIRNKGLWRKDFDIPKDETDQAYVQRMKEQQTSNKEDILIRLQERERQEQRRIPKEWQASKDAS